MHCQPSQPPHPFYDNVFPGMAIVCQACYMLGRYLQRPCACSITGSPALTYLCCIFGVVANTNAVVTLHSLLPLQWQDPANLCFTSNSSPAVAELLQGSYSSLQTVLGHSRSWFPVSALLLL